MRCCHIAATLCGFVSLALLLTSLGSDHWLEVKEDLSDLHYGLWKVCLTSPLGNICNDIGMDVEGLFHITRTFMILAVFPGLITCILLFVLFFRSDKEANSIIQFVQISSFLAGVFAMVALTIFTSSYMTTSTISSSYGWSAILGWVCVALFLVTCLVALIAMIIFTASYDSKLSFGWSAILGWIGAGMFLLTGLFCCIARSSEEV